MKENEEIIKIKHQLISIYDKIKPINKKSNLISLKIFDLISYISNTIDILVTIRFNEEFSNFFKEQHSIKLNKFEDYEDLLRKEENEIRFHIKNNNILKIENDYLNFNLEKILEENNNLKEQIKKLENNNKKGCNKDRQFLNKYFNNRHIKEQIKIEALKNEKVENEYFSLQDRPKINNNAKLKVDYPFKLVTTEEYYKNKLNNNNNNDNNNYNNNNDNDNNNDNNNNINININENNNKINNNERNNVIINNSFKKSENNKNISLNNTNSLDSKNNINNSLKNLRKERKNNTENSINSKKKIDTENRKKDLNKLLSFANSLY